jgi:hypothetical protein
MKAAFHRDASTSSNRLRPRVSRLMTGAIRIFGLVEVSERHAGPESSELT